MYLLKMSFLDYTLSGGRLRVLRPVTTTLCSLLLFGSACTCPPQEETSSADFSLPLLDDSLSQHVEFTLRDPVSGEVVSCSWEPQTSEPLPGGTGGSGGAPAVEGTNESLGGAGSTSSQLDPDAVVDPRAAPEPSEASPETGIDEAPWQCSPSPARIWAYGSEQKFRFDDVLLRLAKDGDLFEVTAKAKKEVRVSLKQKLDGPGDSCFLDSAEYEVDRAWFEEAGAVFPSES